VNSECPYVDSLRRTADLATHDAHAKLSMRRKERRKPAPRWESAPSRDGNEVASVQQVTAAYAAQPDSQ